MTRKSSSDTKGRTSRGGREITLTRTLRKRGKGYQASRIHKKGDSLSFWKRQSEMEDEMTDVFPTLFIVASRIDISISLSLPDVLGVHNTMSPPPLHWCYIKLVISNEMDLPPPPLTSHLASYLVFNTWHLITFLSFRIPLSDGIQTQQCSRFLMLF